MKWKNRTPKLADELARLKSLDPHELLSVAIDASADEIRRAYRDLVRIYHPDKSSPFMRSHNEEVVKLLNAAYETLMASRGQIKT